MTVIPLPTPAYQYGKVVGRVIHAIADTPDDVDAYPEGRPAQGTVTFKPRETLRVVTSPDAVRAFVTHEPVVATLDTNGRLVDAEGNDGIWLVTGTYDVSFQVTRVGAPKLQPLVIAVTTGHTLDDPFDLTEGVSYVPPSSSVTVQTLQVPTGGTSGDMLVKSGDAGMAWIPAPDITAEDIEGLQSNLANKVDTTDVASLAAAKLGIVAGDSTNNSTAFTNAVTTAATASRALLLAGNVRLGSAVTLNQSARVVGTPGAKLTIGHSSNGIDIKPVGVSAGTVQDVALGATTVTVIGAGWTTNQHAGKWAEIFDAAINPGSGETTTHVRRILSNTSTTLTLEHGVGYAIPAGSPLTLYTPLDEVDISNLTIDRITTGSANLIIRYVKSVRLDNVSVTNAGNYTSGTGNALSIYHCDKVRINDLYIHRGGNFGCFIYNCDDVRVNRPTVKHWGGQFGIQLKDCRDGKVLYARISADGSKGDNAISLKCSGLNPASDLAAIDCYAENTRQSGFEFSSITAEGTGFSARDFTFHRCTSYKANTSGFTTVKDAGANPQGYVWRECVSQESTQYGFSGNATPRLKMVDCVARLNRFEGLHVNVSDVEVRGGAFVDNSQAYVSGASRSSEILLDVAANRTLIEGVTFRRTAAGKTVRAVRELAGTNNTLIKDTKIVEEVAGYTGDYVLTGANSKAIGWAAVDSFTGTPTINKKAYTVAT